MLFRSDFHVAEVENGSDDAENLSHHVLLESCNEYSQEFIKYWNTLNQKSKFLSDIFWYNSRNI